MIAIGKNPFFEGLYQNRIKKAFIKPNDKIIELLKNKNIPYEILENNKHREKYGKEAQGYAFEFDIDYINLSDLANRKDENNIIAILDHIQDPHNFGAVVRAGHCFGVKTYIIAKDNQCPITPAVVKSSAGAVVYSNFIVVTNISRTIEELKVIGYWIYASDINGDHNLEDLSPNYPAAIIIGSEGEGVRTNILKKSDIIFKIPMKAKIDSLNASQSAAISFYEFSKKIIR
ncbi:MAG: 23S rRNA (guanosine(2251)-2'-O)-methyltransferase RlmB [Deferribacterales bacterium]